MGITEYMTNALQTEAADDVPTLKQLIEQQREMMSTLAAEKMAWQRAAELAQTHVSILIRTLEKFL